jgi:hypothetical protein
MCISVNVKPTEEDAEMGNHANIEDAGCYGHLSGREK